MSPHCSFVLRFLSSPPGYHCRVAVASAQQIAAQSSIGWRNSPLPHLGEMLAGQVALRSREFNGVDTEFRYHPHESSPAMTSLGSEGSAFHKRPPSDETSPWSQMTEFLPAIFEGSRGACESYLSTLDKKERASNCA